MIQAERLARLVRRYQAGLLLDTNVLLLYLADLVGPAFVQRWHRTDHFGPRYIVPLRAAVGAASRMVTTPHVLTEVTNFTTGGTSGDRDLKRLKALISDFIRRAEERHVSSRFLVDDPAFMWLGLADVAQIWGGRRRRPLVLTLDAPLSAELERRSLPVANLTHYAFPSEEFL